MIGVGCQKKFKEWVHQECEQMCDGSGGWEWRGNVQVNLQDVPSKTGSGQWTGWSLELKARGSSHGGMASTKKKVPMLPKQQRSSKSCSNTVNTGERHIWDEQRGWWKGVDGDIQETEFISMWKEDGCIPNRMDVVLTPEVTAKKEWYSEVVSPKPHWWDKDHSHHQMERAKLMPNACRHRWSGSNDYGMLLWQVCDELD